MNKLITSPNGGFPWVLDDFRFENEQTRDAFHKLCQGLVGSITGDAIVVGVDITGSGSTLNVSAGYLIVAGELVRVDAHTVSNIELGGDYYHVTITDTDLAAGTKTMSDGSTHEAYTSRRATIQVGSFPLGADVRFGASYFPTLPEAILAATSNEYSGAWTSIAATSLTIEPVSLVTAVSGTLRYKKVGRIAHVQFKLVLTYSSANGVMNFTLPSAISPAQDIVLGAATFVNGDGARAAGYAKTTSGGIQIKKTDDTIFDVTNDLTFEGSYTFETAS